MKVNKGEGSVTINLAAQQDKFNRAGEKIGNKNEKRNSIYAGDINLKQNDPITDKKLKAKRDALKNIMDTFAGEQGVDMNQKASQRRIDELGESRQNSLAEMNKLDDLKTQTKEGYNISDDSTEQKDLELLEKQRDILKNGSDEVLSTEEQQRLQDMGPMTDYQKEMLKYDDMKDVWQERHDNAGTEMMARRKSIAEMEVERLKSSPMVKANKIADAIMESASKEIIGMLKQEVVDHVDETLEENKEKGEIQEEKKEEQEAIQNKEDSSNQADNDQIEQMTDIDDIQKDISKEIKKLQKELTDEDLKGLKVNQKI